MLSRTAKVTILALYLAMLGAMLAMSVSAGDPPSSGDWIIDDTTTLAGTDITVRGNITVQSGGTLTLIDLDLLVDLPHTGAYAIEIKAGGSINLDHVTVDSVDRVALFNLTIDGTATIQNHSTIRRMNGSPSPDPFSTPQGLVITSSTVYIYNTTIAECGGFAIAVVPGGVTTINPLFVNCIIRNNGGGMYCGGVIGASADPRLFDCVFYGNGAGEVLAIAASPRFERCTFGALGSLSLTGVSAVANAKPVLVECEFSWLGSALNSVLANPKVRDCSISFCAIGINILGGTATITGTWVTNCPISMLLNSTTASILDCNIASFATLTYAIQIDSGKPHIKDMNMALTAIGGAISIVNWSKAQIEHSTFTGTGGSDVIVVEGSAPTLYWCTIERGQDGVDLSWSPAWIERCTLRDNSGWGILTRYMAATTTGNHFGIGAHENGDGREILMYSMRVRVEFENGTPAEDAVVTVESHMDLMVFDVMTDPNGLAFDAVLTDHEIANNGKKTSYTPYHLEAVLGDLMNRTYPDLSTNPDITLVLRPRPNPPPVILIHSPTDGASYNVWQYMDLIPIEGEVWDKEGEDVNWSWWLDGVYLETKELAFEMTVPIGDHEIMLEGRDASDQVSRMYLNFTVVSIPPSSNYVRVISPKDDDVFELGDVVPLVCEYRVRDHPGEAQPQTLPVRWSSSIDGDLMEGSAGIVDDLTPGIHVITATVEPRYGQYIPEAYNDSVTIEVLPPDPVAVANISSPIDGADYVEGDVVPFSAEGSTLDIWDPLDHRVVYSWTSDIDGILGEGKELEGRYLSVGTHVVTLELFTVPALVSDTAQVTVTIIAPPNNLPYARISLLTLNDVAGKEVNLSAAGSVDEDGDPLTYRWDMGDGNVSTGINVTHVYAAEGNYTVNLTVSDGMAEAHGMVNVHVRPAPVVPPDNGGNGGNGGGGGDGDDDGVRDPDEEFYGWLVLVLLLAGLASMLVLTLRGHRGEQ